MYAYKRSLTIDHAQCGSSDSSSFPVLVKLDATNCGTTLKTVGNGGHIQNTVTQTGGNAVTMPADLIFTSDSGGTTKIPWEIESYDAVNGILWAWVQLATVSHTSDTVFYVFYGDVSVSTQQNTSSFAPSAVWDGNYKGVYHLPNGSSLSLSDSTSNANNGSNNGATATTGQIDGAGAFNGSSNIDLGTQTSLQNATALTLSGWIYFNAVSSEQRFGHWGDTNVTDRAFVIINSSGQWIGAISNASVSFAIATDSVHTAVINTWYYVTLTFQSSTATFYLNGVSSASASGVTDTGNFTGNTFIGSQNSSAGFVDGRMDEVRISNVARSADWILAEYNNQLNPESFVSAGSETTLTGILSRIRNVFQAVNRANTY